MKKRKNTLIKVILLVLAVVVCVTGVLIFMKTRVQPPTRIDYINPYTEDIHKESERLENATDADISMGFPLIINRIELMKQENLLTEGEQEECLNEFVNSYIPAFRLWCENQFSQSVWPKETLDFMQQRLNELNHYKTHPDGSALISEENTTRVEEVRKILKDYNEAWTLGRIQIKKASDSRTHLRKANAFKQDPHLSKCTALVNFLNQLPSKYQKSHYNHVKAKVDKLGMTHYPQAEQIHQWAEQYKASKEAIKDYNSVAQSLYRVTQNNFNIDSYYEEAKSGFRSKINCWDPIELRDEYEDTFGSRIYCY